MTQWLRLHFQLSRPSKSICVCRVRHILGILYRTIVQMPRSCPISEVLSRLWKWRAGKISSDTGSSDRFESLSPNDSESDASAASGF